MSANDAATFLAASGAAIVGVRAPGGALRRELSGGASPRSPTESPTAERGAAARHCAGGYRSSCAVSLLLGMGFSEVADLEGGFHPGLVTTL